MKNCLTQLADNRFGLPAVRHIPGSGSQPDNNYFADIKSLCPATTNSEQWQTNTTYRSGWHLFNNGFFWEAHEIWELVWMRCPPNSREKILLQAIIQIANARLKVLGNKHHAARRLQQQVTYLLDELYSRLSAEPEENMPIMGLDENALRALNA